MPRSSSTGANVTVYQVVRKEVVSDNLTVYWVVLTSEHGEESGHDFARSTDRLEEAQWLTPNTLLKSQKA